MPMRVALIASLAATVLAAQAARAQDVGPELRQLAIDACSGDAIRLCPMSLMDEGSVVSCMSTKRDVLTRSCRVVYDRVARTARQ